MTEKRIEMNYENYIIYLQAEYNRGWQDGRLKLLEELEAAKGAPECST